MTKCLLHISLGLNLEVQILGPGLAAHDVGIAAQGPCSAWPCPSFVPCGLVNTIAFNITNINVLSLQSFNTLAFGPYEHCGLQL